MKEVGVRFGISLQRTVRQNIQSTLYSVKVEYILKSVRCNEDYWRKKCQHKRLLFRTLQVVVGTFKFTNKN